MWVTLGRISRRSPGASQEQGLAAARIAPVTA